MRLLSRLLLASASLLIACDPGYTYHPDDWQPLDKGWRKSLDGIDVDLYNVIGLEGSQSTVPSLKVTNRTDQLLVLEEAELITQDKGTFKADFPDSGALLWRSVGPSESKSIELGWDFDQLAVDVLGEHPEVVLHLRHGSQAERIEIRFSRVK